MDFNQEQNRKGTYSTQWDFTIDRFGRDDVLPFSISDTDFKAPPEIIAALKEVVSKGIFGYTRWNHADFSDALVNYYQTRHQTNLEGVHFIFSPSVMYSVSLLLRLLSNDDDGVLVFSPMYDAFYDVVCENNRQLIESNLIHDEGHYEIDFADIEKKAKQAKIFLLCSPHNPTGRVWTKDELNRLMAICKKYKLKLISDEIHSDIVFGGRQHIPILKDTLEEDIYLVSSASKTFNTPSLIGSYVLLRNKNVYDQFLHQTRKKDFLNSASMMGMTAMMAGYQHSLGYIDELIDYIQDNFVYLKKALNEISPQLFFEIPEATYLAWIDVSKLELDEQTLQMLLINKGKVGIMSGIHYGDGHYLRMNCGCSRSKLEEGIKRIKIALKGKV